MVNLLHPSDRYGVHKMVFLHPGDTFGTVVEVEEKLDGVLEIPEGSKQPFCDIEKSIGKKLVGAERIISPDRITYVINGFEIAHLTFCGRYVDVFLFGEPVIYQNANIWIYPVLDDGHGECMSKVSPRGYNDLPNFEYVMGIATKAGSNEKSRSKPRTLPSTEGASEFIDKLRYLEYGAQIRIFKQLGITDERSAVDDDYVRKFFISAPVKCRKQVLKNLEKDVNERKKELDNACDFVKSSVHLDQYTRFTISGNHVSFKTKSDPIGNGTDYSIKAELNFVGDSVRVSTHPALTLEEILGTLGVEPTSDNILLAMGYEDGFMHMTTKSDGTKIEFNNFFYHYDFTDVERITHFLIDGYSLYLKYLKKTFEDQRPSMKIAGYN